MLLSKRLDVVIRDAGPTDLAQMFDVRGAVDENRMTRVELAARGITEDSVRSRLAGELRAWVADAGGEVVGFSMAERASGVVYAVFVLPAFQKRGVGTALLARATSWLAELGFRSLSLTTDPSTRAYGYYQRRGWVDVGETSGSEHRLELTL